MSDTLGVMRIAISKLMFAQWVEPSVTTSSSTTGHRGSTTNLNSIDAVTFVYSAEPTRGKTRENETSSDNISSVLMEISNPINSSDLKMLAGTRSRPSRLTIVPFAMIGLNSWQKRCRLGEILNLETASSSTLAGSRSMSPCTWSNLPFLPSHDMNTKLAWTKMDRTARIRV